MKWIWLYVFLLASNVLALNPAISVSHYIYDSWTTKEGLPQDTVQVIYQDHHGYLWVGTQGGLAQFDGLRFTNFTSLSTFGFPHGSVLSITETNDGSLWVGTLGGLGRYKNARW